MLLPYIMGDMPRLTNKEVTREHDMQNDTLYELQICKRVKDITLNVVNNCWFIELFCYEVFWCFIMEHFEHKYLSKDKFNQSVIFIFVVQTHRTVPLDRYVSYLPNG